MSAPAAATAPISLNAACYSFSVALFFLVVIERVANACCTLLVRLIWGRQSSHSSSQGALLGTLVSHLRSECNLREGDTFFGPRMQYLLDVHANLSSIHSDAASMHDIKGYASMQMVGAGVTFFSTVSSVALSCIVNAISVLSMYAVWATAAMLVFSLLFVLQENYSDVLVDAVDQYNSTYGPILYKIVFIPLQVLDVMFSSLIPLYNMLIWVVRLIFHDVFLESLINNVPSIRSFGLALGSLCKHTALEIAPYVSAMAIPCNYAKDGDLCYEPGHSRTIDFVTIMAEVRTMASAVSRIALSICAAATAPLNIILFPLMDINLAKGVHNLLNSVLYTIFQLPSVTAQRCLNHGIDPATKLLRAASPGGGAGASILMCLPDFNPPINMLAAGLRNVGLLIDNWLDVSSVIAQRSLGLLDDGEAECKGVARALTPASYSKQLFGTSSEAVNRQKIVVGLTDGLYAVTDGVHAQYFNHYDSVESIASPYVWPIEIDTRYGVAAVTYRAGSGSEDRDSMGDASTTMLGCRCSDNNGLPPIRIQCALALKTVGTTAAAASAYAGSSSSGNEDGEGKSPLLSSFQTVFDVVFQQRSTADYMTCKMTQISVQSVRWPATRFSGR